jgi:hypothetical protein
MPHRWINLEYAFGQIPVVFLSDLGLVGGPVKHRRIVVDVVDVNNDRRIVFVQIVRSNQPQLILDEKREWTEICSVYDCDKT